MLDYRNPHRARSSGSHYSKSPVKEDRSKISFQVEDTDLLFSLFLLIFLYRREIIRGICWEFFFVPVARFLELEVPALRPTRQQIYISLSIHLSICPEREGSLFTIAPTQRAYNGRLIARRHRHDSWWSAPLYRAESAVARARSQ